MAQISLKQYDPPLLLQLPGEIMEDVLSEIELHQDLIAFALVSRACAGLVIPRHTEYRIIRVRHSMPYMWAHLARRADLARNIREVHIRKQDDHTAVDLHPVTLLNSEADGRLESAEEGTRIRNLCEALGHMRHLQVFSWSRDVSALAVPSGSFIHEDSILHVISQKFSLRHLALSGNPGAHVRDGLSPDGRSYPVWNISNLQSLSLLGGTWARPSNRNHFRRMLGLSPDLEFLEVPMEFSGLSECRFPRLKRLKLPLLWGATSSVDVSMVSFIDHHPTIEELSWTPIGDIALPSNSLPSIRCLQTRRQVVTALEEMESPRFIECLDVRSLDSGSLASLRNLDRGSLQKLNLHAFGSIESVCHLADIFPAISWLSMPIFHMPPDAIHPSSLTVENWLNILSRFRNLEVFRGGGLWFAVGQNKEAMHAVIHLLVRLCPKLRQLDHCDFYEKRGDWKRIIILREGPEGENVRYEVHKPPPRWNSFDTMGKVFD